MIDDVLRDITIKPLSFDNWRFKKRETSHGPQVSAQVDVTCIATGKTRPLHCEWRHFEPGTPENECVRGIADMVIKVVMHEVMETYLYRGKQPFSPHAEVVP